MQHLPESGRYGARGAEIQPPCDEVCFAGIAPIIIRLANGEVVIIAGLGHWPNSMPADMFMRKHGGEILIGV